MSRQGRHGEWKFGEICTGPDAKAVAVVNKANDDQHGWDHILEIVPPKNSQLPADLQRHVVQCFAQIKTTNGTFPKTKLKLSNAVKAVKSPLPSFVFMLHYTGGLSQPQIYGRHVWEKEITHWLKRARQTEIKGRKDLHKLSVSISFTEDDRLKQNPVDWILSTLSKYGGEEYSNRKISLVNTTGYEEISHDGTFTFGPLDSKSDVVLHELGLIEDLPVQNFRLYDTRFGIRSKTPVNSFSTGRVKFGGSGRPVSLRLFVEKSTSIDIPAMMWAPTVVELAHEEFRARVKSGHIDIVISKLEKTKNFKMSYTTQEKLPLLQQLGFLCLINWSQKGEVEYSVNCDRGKLLGGQFGGPMRQEAWMPAYEKIGHHIVEIVGKENAANILLSFRDFGKLDKSIFFAASVLTAGALRFEAEFDETIEPFAKAIGYYAGRVGEWSFGAIWQMSQKSRGVNQGKQSFYFDQPKVVWKQAFKQPLDQLESNVQEEFKRFKDSHVEAVATFEDGNLVAFSRTLSQNGSVSMSVDEPKVKSLPTK